MSSMLRYEITSAASANTVKGRLRLFASGFAPAVMGRLADLINGSLAAYSMKVNVATTAVQATGRVTPSSMVADDTVTIGTVTLTCSDSTQDGTHFKPGASDTACVANIATCINANTTLSKIMTATSSGTTMTATVNTPGYLGNQIAISASAHASVAGMSGGSEDTNVVVYNGQA